MTIQEIQTEYGTRNYIPSVGMTIWNILDILYGSRDDIYYYALQRLNHRVDWDNIVDLSPIKYFSKIACAELYEIQD